MSARFGLGDYRVKVNSFTTPRKLRFLGDVTITEDTANDRFDVTVTGGGGGSITGGDSIATAGEDVFSGENSGVLEFRGIDNASTKTSVVYNAGNKTIDIDVVEANLNLANIGGTLADGSLSANVLTTTNTKTATNKTIAAEDNILQNVGPFKYEVFLDGSNWTARNCITGAITSTNTTFITVLQAALDALTSSRTIKESVRVRGVASVTGAISIPSYTILNLEDAKLTLANSTATHMFVNSDTSGGNTQIEIIGGIIDGNKTNQAAVPGDEDTRNIVQFTKVNDSHVRYMYIDEASARAIRFNTCVNCEASYNTVLDTGGEGIQTKDGSDNKILFNTVKGTGYSFITTFGTEDAIIAHNYCDDTVSTTISGINISSTGNQVICNTIKNMGGSGIYLSEATSGYNSSGVKIIGNEITGSGDACGILAAGYPLDGALISGNRIYSNFDEGIRFSGAHKNIQIFGNNISLNGGSGIYVSGTAGSSAVATHVQIMNNMSYNNGTAGGSNNWDRAGINVRGTDTDGVVDIIVKNNTCYDDQGSPTQKYGVYIQNSLNSLVQLNNLKNNLTDGLISTTNSGLRLIENNGYASDNVIVGTQTANTYGSFDQTIPTGNLKISSNSNVGIIAVQTNLTGTRTWAFPNTSTNIVGTGTTDTLTNKSIVLSSNTITDTSRAQGDLIKDNGTKYVRFAMGSANQILRVNSGGTDLEYGALPTASLPTHASTHQSGGGDAIKLDDLATPDDNTDLNASTSRHGLLLKLDNDTDHFLCGDGTWATPAGSGTGAPDDAQYVTLATNGSLSDERVLTAGTNISITDGGAGSTVTVDIGTNVITTSNTKTLTNKTIDADSNTISNIDNNEIKAAAGIVTSKLADASNFVLVNQANTYAGNDQTIPTGNLKISSNGNVGVIAVQTNLTGTRTWAFPNASTNIVGTGTTDTLTNKTLTAPIIATISNTGTITLPTATCTLVGKDTTDTLTNKTIDADGTGNSITNIENADIKAAAGIVTTKLADSTNFVLTNRTNTFGAFDQIFPTSRLLIGDSDASHSYIIAGSNLAANRTITLPLLAGNDTAVMEAFTQTLTNKTINIASNTLTGVAPSDPQYVTLATNSTLSNERVLTAGTGISVTDAGAGSTVTLAQVPTGLISGWSIMETDFTENIANSVFDDWPSGTAAGGFTDSVETDALGVWTLYTGTDTTGRMAYISNDNGYKVGGATLTLIMRVRIPVLSVLAQRFIFRIGFGDSVSGEHTDGIYFEYDEATSANWRIVTANNTTRTKATSGTAVPTDTWVWLKIIVNSAGNSASFYVNGSEVTNSPIATNLPGSTRTFGIVSSIIKSAGTTGRDVDMDYIGAFAQYNSSRGTF